MSGVARGVCPVCLQPIPASHVTEGDDVPLVKECPDHGLFRRAQGMLYPCGRT